MTTLKYSIVSICCIAIFSSAAWAGQPYDYAAMWNGMSVSDRESFVMGYMSGYVMALEEVARKLPAGKQCGLSHVSKKTEKLRGYLYELSAHFEPTIETIGELYSDPNNRFIETRLMIKMALMKVKGVQIDEHLIRVSREIAEGVRIGETILPKLRETSINCRPSTDTSPPPRKPIPHDNPSPR